MSLVHGHAVSQGVVPCGDCTRLGVLLVGLGLWSVLAGCGGAEPDPRGVRVGVQGHVTLDGKPLSRAIVLFLPADGKAKVKATGTIQDGRFQIAPEDGPLAGKCRVEIHPEAIELEELEAARGKDRRKPPGRLNAVQIPPQFNVRLQLTADLAPNHENSLDVNLSTKN